MVSQDNILKLAKAIHADYCKNYPGTDYAVPWDALPENIQQANIDQTKNFERYAALVGCEIVPETKYKVSSPQFSGTELTAISKEIHRVWVQSKLADGWIYASVRDNSLKHHPMLVEWDALPSEEKEKDYAVAWSIIPLVSGIGLSVTRDYSAFISYRHTEKDIPLSQEIHKFLEAFVVPTHKLRKELRTKKLGKFFRDKDELPQTDSLSESIKKCIRESDWLMAFLCPAYMESDYCMLELNYFIECHGVERVIPIITEGKTTATIPDFLLPLDDTGVRQEPLSIIIEEEYDKDGKQLKDEKLRNRLRIIARFLGSKFDQLYDRFHRQRMETLRKRAALVIAVILLFLAGAVFAAKQIEKQRNTALDNEMSLLLESSINAVESGDRLAGIRYSLNALNIYERLYLNGDSEKSRRIQQTLDGAVYCQGFQLLAPIKNNNRKFGWMVYSPDDQYILGAFGEYTAALIDAHTGDILADITRSRPYLDNNLAFFDFSPSGEYFVTGFGYFSCEVIVWKTGRNPEEIASYSLEENFIGGQFLSNGELILGRYPSLGNEIVVWDFSGDKTRRPTASEEQEFNKIKPDTEGYAGRLSPDGKYRFEYDMFGDEPTRVYDADSGRLMGELPGVGLVSGFSNDGRYIVAGSWSGFCGIFSTPQSATAVIVDEYGGSVYQYPSWFEIERTETLIINSTHFYEPQLYPAFQQFMLNDPSGRFYATVFPDAFVEVWDLEKDSVNAVYGLREHIGAIQTAYMTAEFLITAGYDGRVMIFELRTGHLKNCFTVENGIAALNLDPTGTRAIAVGRSVKHAYVYDLDTGLQIYRLDAEPDMEIEYFSIGFSEDGNLAIAKQKDGRVIVGTIFLSFDELIEYAKNSVS